MHSVKKSQALSSRRKAPSSRGRARALSSRRKAQGVPLEVVVAGILMLIVVAVVMIAFGGGFSSVFKKLNIFATEQAGEDVDLMEERCAQACLKLSDASQRGVINSEYCLLRWDTSGHGGMIGDTCLDDPNPEDIVHFKCRVGKCVCVNCSRETDTVCNCGE